LRGNWRENRLIRGGTSLAGAVITIDALHT
jgi:predicted transposase YbfD/YdcC